MRIKAARLICGIIVSSFLFAGCSSKAPEETVTSEVSQSSENNASESATSENASSESEEPKPDNALHLDETWLEKMRDLYVSKVPEQNKFAIINIDGLRGRAAFHPDFNDCFSFECSTLKGTQLMRLNINPKNETVFLSFDFQYDDARFCGEGVPVGLDEIETYVTNLIEGNGAKYDAWEASALTTHAEDLKKDIQVIYTRLIAYSEMGFPELNVTLEDYGIDLGSKFRAYDPSQPTSRELYSKNEHVFEHGTCKDCGMLWTKHFHRVLASVNGIEYAEDEIPSGWFNDFGQNTGATPSDWWYVSYASPDDRCARFAYVKPGEVTTRLDFNVTQSEDLNWIAMYYQIEGDYYPQTDEDPQPYYRFMYYVAADAGEIGDIFASKESLVAASEANLLFYDEDGDITSSAWEEMAEENIKEIFASKGLKYYTKDEFTDLFWAEHEKVLNALDQGMAGYATSFHDIGINLN